MPGTTSEPTFLSHIFLAMVTHAYILQILSDNLTFSGSNNKEIPDTIPLLNSLNRTCHDYLGRSNNTLSQCITGPRYLQNSSLASTWLRLHRQRLVPARIKLFARSSDLPHTQLFQRTRQTPGNKHNTLDPGLIGKFRRR